MAGKRKTVTVKVGIFIEDCGDGSARAQFYKDIETAERVAEKQDQRLCEDVQELELEVDVETGEIVSGLNDENENE